jgi:hypothetical protein
VKQNIFILIFILSLNSYSVRAQNFVPNSSFENITNCPSGYNYLPYALPWTGLYTPDLYAPCASFGSNVNAPYSYFGYQKAQNGTNYAGVHIFDSPASWREWMQVELLDTLKANKLYYISFYVSLSNLSDYTISNIGILFSDSTITHLMSGGGASQPFFTYYLDNIHNQNGIISDTLNWIRIEGTYMPNTDKLYMLIGNFDSIVDSVRTNYSNGSDNTAYYYIDNINIYDITNGNCNNYWDAGSDKYISYGDSLKLGAINTDGSTFIWQNSLSGNTFLSSNIDANPWAKPLETTTYYVTKTCPNNYIYIDTVTVFVYIKPDKINLGKDSLYCGTANISPIILDAGLSQGCTYHWSTGATTQTISVSNSGTYSVNVISPTASLSATAPYSTTSDVINFLFLDPTNDAGILHDTDLCSSSQFPVTLNASVPIVSGTTNSYTWVGGHVGAQLTVNSPGTYIVTIWIRDLSNPLLCKVKDTAIVTVGCVGIKQFIDNNSQLNIYPNPSSGIMILDYNIKADANLEISDLSGRLVGTYFLPATGTHTEVKNNELYNGVYIYRVTSNGVVIKIGKIIVMQ